jgi:bicarbonate transport system ATP-binding protein
MVQMARWGDTVFPRNWVEILERMVRVGPFSTAARELGMSDITYNRGSLRLFDGSVFNADDPIGYLNNLAIKRDFTMAEVILDSARRVA